MLIAYFLRQFVYRTLLYLMLITFVLASSNVFVRLPGIVNICIIPKLFLVMLPLVILFAFPLAVPLAILGVIGNVINQEALLPLLFMKKATRALFRAVILFMFITVGIYAPLLFFWAPASYDRGKQLLIGHAYEQIQHLDPKTFHFLLDGISIYFVSKVIMDNKTIFDHLLLMITSKKHHDRYFFSAEKGIFFGDELLLEKGSLVFIKRNHHDTACFSHASLDLRQLLNVDRDHRMDEAKLKILPQLIQDFLYDRTAQIELYKRLAQLFWQFLLPLITLFLMFSSFGAQRNLLLWGIIFSGLLFFMQYASLTLAQALQHISYLPFFIFFSPPIMIIFYLFRRVVL